MHSSLDNESETPSQQKKKERNYGLGVVKPEISASDVLQTLCSDAPAGSTQKSKLAHLVLWPLLRK